MISVTNTIILSRECIDKARKKYLNIAKYKIVFLVNGDR